jgi:UDPglucose--hexose-1-phosphate uridylyltransferase
VPNLFPVVAPAEGPSPANELGAMESGVTSSIDPLGTASRGEVDLFRSQPADGRHEVIVASPRHVTSLAQLDDAELAGAVESWRERLRAHPDAAYTHLIVNEGPEAGASLEHAHAQLYALGFVPAEIARERERAGAYHQRTMGSHLLGDVGTEEVRRRERLVAVDDDCLLVCPWASRSPFELRVIPRRPTARFEDGAGGAEAIGAAMRGLASVLGAVPQLNLWVRTAPRGAEEFCWHIDLIPRLTIRAGFELGTGVDINVYAPERAAADLREALG